MDIIKATTGYVIHIIYPYLGFISSEHRFDLISYNQLYNSTKQKQNFETRRVKIKVSFKKLNFIQHQHLVYSRIP